MKISGIYKIVNKVNGKYYVGSSNDMLAPYGGRKYSHFWSLRKNRHCNRHLQSAWNKYGENNFDFTIVERCADDKITLLSIEQKYLDIAKSERNLTYNLSFIAGKIDMTKETRRLIGLSKVGNKYCLGRPCTQQTRDKISKSNTGKRRSSKTCEKMSKSRIGKYVGKNSPSFGLKRSAETRRKISEKCSGLFVGEKSYRYDYTIYNFININTNETFAGTRHSFYTKYNYVNKANLCEVIDGKTNRKTVNGWKIINNLASS